VLSQNIAKTITDEQKYNGINRIFGQKLIIFIDICNRVDLSEDQLTKTFPAILKKIVLNYYYNNKFFRKTTIDKLCEYIRNLKKNQGLIVGTSAYETLLRL
jgi:hypothetical protein